jgi:voltage-gated potassium channel Kch
VPDWSYHTVLRPASRLVPRDRIRPLVLHALAAIAGLPGGPTFIELLGHMDPPTLIARKLGGLQLPSPVGLGSTIDPDGVATGAFARFGFGAIEVDGSVYAGRRFHRRGRVRVLARFAEGDDPDAARLEERLRKVAGDVDGVILCGSGGFTDRAAAAARAAGVERIVLDRDIVRGGLSSPREMVDAINSGARLVLIGTGFVEAGPGLAKRANEALAGMLPPLPRERRPAWREGWPWIALLGAGMTIAGLSVLAVGLTRVTLPYDESFLGLSHDAIAALNPHLLGFMKHDRVTLAGTLVSLGILYSALALGGMRRGLRWARSAMVASGAVGFASVFLFLGFHYVDPLHVALAVGLFPLFLAGVLLPTPPRWPPSQDLDNDGIWRAGLWGQLYFIALGAGLTVAGVIIASVGVTSVFVWSDLQFLATTSDALARANSHLLPLIAHDRAGFGGALASDGIAVMLLALWGFRRGERWVWWSLLLAGAAGFLGAVYAHVAVGYLELGHLFPVAVSGAVYIAGLVLSAPYLLARRAESRRADQHLVSRAPTWR